MSRATPSRRVRSDPAPGAVRREAGGGGRWRRGTADSLLRVLALAAALAPAVAAASWAGTGPDAGCGPIPTEEAVAVAARSEPGVVPSRGPNGGEGPGEIVQLPRAPDAPHPAAIAGEALLALPKRPDGSIPTDFELAPDASVAESFFSPVLCATVVRVVGPPGRTAEALVTRVPEGAALVPNHVYVPAATEVRPLGEPAIGPDPYRSLQWGLERSGAERAWSVSDGRGARVALLDSAPEASHRDLAGVRVVPLPDAPEPAPGVHGTLLAGIVRAAAGNDYGIAGIAPGASLVAIPVCEPAGASASDTCPLHRLLRGVDGAWEEHAQIVNLSLVGPPDPLLRKAMDRLDALGVVTVAAAGNEGVAEPRYPAAYPSVIGVGAIDAEGHRYARGNRGPAVELLAPGVEILSTVPGGGFAFGDGTSLAAAHVTGALALAVGAGADPPAARAALFAAAQAHTASPGNEPAPLPAACDLLAQLGHRCR